MHAAVIKAQEAAFKSERKQYAVGEVATKFIKYGIKLIIIVVTLMICWWVWFEFFDPGGKIAWKWEKSFSVDNFHFLTYDKTKINCIAGDKFRSFDTQTGKILTERSEKKLEDCQALLNHSGSRYIFRSGSCVQVIDGEGTVVWRKEFSDAGFSDVEVRRIFALVRETNALDESKIEEARQGFLASRRKESASS